MKQSEGDLGVTCCGCLLFCEAGDIQITLHSVEIGHERMSELLAERISDQELFLRARAMVLVSEAKLFDTVIVRGKENEHVILESVRDVSYPTPYYPPSFPPGKEEQERRKKIREGWKKVARFFPVFPGGWEGSFETRWVGLHFEMTSSALGTAADRWHLSLGEQRGSVPLAKARNLNGGMVESRYPLFASTSVGSDLPPADGRWRMQSVFTPPADGNAKAMDKKVLVFVRVDVLR